MGIQSFHISYHVAYMGDSRSEYRVLVGRPDRQTAIGRHRHRGKDNNKLAVHTHTCRVHKFPAWPTLKGDRN